MYKIAICKFMSCWNLKCKRNDCIDKVPFYIDINVSHWKMIEFVMNLEKNC